MEAAYSDFDAFFRAEYPRLVGALSVAVGPELAADAAQEAFVRANARWSRVRRMDRPGAWTRRVALNLVTDHHRRFRWWRAIDPLLVTDEVCELEPRDRDLAEALATLPTRQRLVVTLHYLLDLSVADIAGELGISEGTVKATFHQARASLRAKLGVIDDVN